MSQPDEIFLNVCPQCGADLKWRWFTCPQCGYRLKSGKELLYRAAGWLGVLMAFVTGLTVISKYDTNTASAVGALLGFPLAYVFGKAVVFRLSGSPMSWPQLRNTSLRAIVTAIAVMVVLPVVIGIALLIFLFAVCSGLFGR